MLGTSSGLLQPFWRAYGVAVGLITVVDVVNVLSALHDAVRRGEHLAAWEPITWEATSGVAELLAYPLIYIALRLAPAQGRWGRALLVHSVSTLVFSALHVALMMALRIAIYRTQGFHYRVESGAVPYEYRKDLLAYLVLAGVFHLITGQGAQAKPEPAARPRRSRSRRLSTSWRAREPCVSARRRSWRSSPTATMRSSTSPTDAVRSCGRR